METLVSLVPNRSKVAESIRVVTHLKGERLTEVKLYKYNNTNTIVVVVVTEKPA